MAVPALLALLALGWDHVRRLACQAAATTEPASGRLLFEKRPRVVSWLSGEGKKAQALP